MSSNHHTLELMCDSIRQYEVDIAYLAETNNYWKHPHGEASLNATKNRHWRTSNGVIYTNREALRY